MTSPFDRGAATLASLHEQAMPNNAVVEAKASVRIPGGAYTDTWAPLPGASYPCRLSPLTVAEQLVAMQTESTATWRLALPVGTVVDPKHRIVVTGETDGVAWSKTLSVVGQLGPRSHESVRLLLCADWKEGG